jgi:hypothetical protein
MTKLMAKDKPGRRMGFKSGESVVDVVFVTHIAKSAEIDALTDKTLPSHACDSVFFTGIAYNVWMSDTNRRVVQNS